jgi:hypothetical protein
MLGGRFPAGCVGESSPHAAIAMPKTIEAIRRICGGLGSRVTGNLHGANDLTMGRASMGPSIDGINSVANGLSETT